MANKSGPITTNRPTHTSISVTLHRTPTANGKGFYYTATQEFTADGREIKPLIAVIPGFNGAILGNPAQIVVTIALPSV